jgi:uncharacterized protein (DUF1697 family)
MSSKGAKRVRCHDRLSSLRAVPRYVGLLRAVNVGGRNSVPMPALRELVESLGFTDVSTYIQSGNVLFTSPRAVKAQPLESAIAKQFGVKSAVMLRTERELVKALDANPFPSAPTATVHIGFMASKPSAAAVRKVEADPFAPEEFVVVGREYFLHLPNGMGRSKLGAYVQRKFDVPATVRNWKTVSKLIDLLRA